MQESPADVQERHRFLGTVGILFIGGFLIVLIGFVAEYLFCRDMLSRFGAVLILVELVATWKLKNDMDNERFDWLRMEVVTLCASSDFGEDFVSKALPGMSRKEAATWLRSVHDKYSGRYATLNSVQVLFLTVGTVMWAFGDLFLNFDRCTPCIP